MAGGDTPSILGTVQRATPQPTPHAVSLLDPAATPNLTPPRQPLVNESTVARYARPGRTTYLAEDVGALRNRWQQLVKQAVDPGQSTPSAIDLTQLFQQVPLGSGFWERLLNGNLTEEDHTLAYPALGSEVTPALQDQLVRQIAQTYILPVDTQTGAPITARQAQPGPNWGAIGNAVGNVASIAGLGPAAPLGAMGALAFGRPQLPAGAGAAAADLARRAGTAITSGVPLSQVPGTTPGAGAGAGAFAEPGGPQQVAPSGAQTSRGAVDKPYELVNLAAGVPGQEDTPVTAVRDKSSGKVFARLYTDRNGVTGFHPAGDFSDPDTFASIHKYATDLGFDSDELLSLDTKRNAVLFGAQNQANALIDSKQAQDLAELKIKMQSGELSLQQATASASQRLAEANASKAQVELEAARLDLALKPLVEQESRLRITAAQMQLDQSNQQFPLQLQRLQEEAATAREQRLNAQRQRFTQERTDQFAQNVYPGMIQSLAVRPAEGPPPIYNQLAQGAGVDPNSPAAQMAYAVLQDRLAGHTIPTQNGGA